MFGLSPKELRVLQKLSTPQKIQDFLDHTPINFEKRGDTYMSPRRVLREKKMHCLEGALLSAAALLVHGEQPLLLDLTSEKGDDDHVVALFKQNGYWGALSKTNHAVLRYRDPIYKTVRELALSYFHEYYLAKNGKKTLVSYSKPFDMRRLGYEWIISENDLWEVEDALNAQPHFPFVPKKNKKYIRPATPFERRVTNETEWKQSDPRT